MALWSVRITVAYANETYNPFYNVFGYRTEVVSPNEPEDLAESFIAEKIDPIRSIIHSAAKITTVDVTELNGVQFWSESVPTAQQPGARTGETMPQYNAWGFEYKRQTLGVRSGAKRIGPISESDVFGNGPTAEMLTLLNTVAGQLTDPVNHGSGGMWVPVILERPAPGSALWGFHDISGVIFKRITTQNSRKR